MILMSYYGHQVNLICHLLDEDYADEYAGPYTGFPLISSKSFYRKTSMYRFYVPDPIRFRRSIKVTVEHGHANNFENNYSSVAYWYQREPHKRFPCLLSAKERIPLLLWGEKKVANKHLDICRIFYSKVRTIQGDAQGSFPAKECLLYILPKVTKVREALFEGKYDFALTELKQLENYVKSL